MNFPAHLYPKPEQITWDRGGFHIGIDKGSQQRTYHFWMGGAVTMKAIDTLSNDGNIIVLPKKFAAALYVYAVMMEKTQ